MTTLVVQIGSVSVRPMINYVATFIMVWSIWLIFAVFRIRIRIRFVSWIQIRIPNADPDPAVDRISSKSQKIHII